MRHLQHLKNTDATCEQRFADINEKQLHPEDDGLQHVNNIVTTPIYNNCNKKNLRKNRRQVLRIRACLGHGWSGSLLLASSAAHATALGCGCAVRGGGAPPLRPRHTARPAHGSNSSSPRMGPLRAGCVTAHRLADLGGSHGSGEQRARERSVGDVCGSIPDAKLATELPGAISSGAASSDPVRSSRRSSLRPLP
jgi:hypothetical protein